MKLKGEVKFLSAMIALYVVAGIFKFDYILLALKNAADLFLRILPILVLVVVVMTIVNLILKPEKIQKHLGHNSGFKGWLYAILGGVFISSPPYILFPILGDMKKQGMKDSLIVAFLYNRNVQLSFLPAMIFYFGLKFTIIISCYIILFSVLSGIFIGKILEKR